MQRLFLSLIALILAILPAHFAGSSIMDETMVLYLSLDEGTGKEVKDGSMYGNDGEIVTNTEWVAGRFRGAVEITGEAVDCVVIPHSDSLWITREITMMAWIRSAGWDGDADQWIDKNCHDGASANSYGMGVFYEGTQILFMLGSGQSRPTFAVDKLPAVDEWQHVAGTYDGKEMSIYLNGELQEGAWIVGEPGFNFQGTNSSELRIGCARDRAKYTFNGVIDEVIIYNRALDEVEIKRLMKNGPLAVSPEGRIAATWATIKGQR